MNNMNKGRKGWPNQGKLPG